MTRPAAVLFDCDGVIVDSEGPTFDLLIETLARHGLRLTRTQLETDYIGGTLETVAARAIAAGATLPPTWVADAYSAMYAMLARGVPLVPGIVATLDALDAARIPYAVGSNGTPEKMTITLGQHGLTPRFRATLSGQAMSKPKPAPDLYLAAAAACDADPAACVVIEDSATGARAALNAGIPCLGFAPHGPDTPPARQLAALGIPLFRRMADLPALLGL
ncbi:HAD family phosphatase [Rhodobacter sp. Har01]|uniref:HAD family hydrolase n=1 Tax=Rhodobacter sp. Har01 TaxID=2883999 RepID=UPI001D0649A9|nr:HAD family phosphatase [Rhodobacter sp. Har01]MCB6179527.1 HAD family phosphatase [Rhodobacter sp. Har01]